MTTGAAYFRQQMMICVCVSTMGGHVLDAHRAVVQQLVVHSHAL